MNVEIKDRSTNVTLEAINLGTSVFTSINLYHEAARLIATTAPPVMIDNNTEGLGSLCKFVPSGGSFNIPWRGHTERNLFFAFVYNNKNFCICQMKKAKQL